jgi:hypothetical protein
MPILREHGAVSRRTRVLTAVAALVLVISGCGARTSSPDLTAPIDTLPTSEPTSVTVPPPTPAEVTTATTRRSKGGSKGGSNKGGSTVTSAAPRTTAAPASTATPTTVRPRKLYELVPAPILPTDRTPPFPKSGTLSDGTYWAMLNAVGAPDADGNLTADVTVYQAFFGDACVSKAASLGDECANGIYVPTSPTRRIASITFKSDVTITVTDVATQKSYYVTPEELRRIQTETPSAGAPKGFTYTPFAYLMRIRSGLIARFRQVWTP